ncbi:hypothetical protein O181_095026 [Austropuccinia psidii MF-1]|uniref:Reverse transcriptase domain-containing protein n=1 Tax=Austropuccinia psidii MF-1 TaxID=1389203 RepID=A0A9Q3J4C0_9BASI|nr:hypothetical protein [Austropuccinia psidii MF-1]
MAENQEAKVNLDTGAYFTCFGKGYLKSIVPDWERKLIPIQEVKFISSSERMKLLVIIDLTLIFPHPLQCIRGKVDIVVMDNCTTNHFKLGNDYFLIYGIDISSQKDRYFTIGDNKNQTFGKPYPPRLRRPAYPASPRAREALEVHPKELLDLGELRKVEHNEQVKVIKPVNINWHNGKSRMVGDFIALNTYTIPDRYQIPRIHETLTQLSQAKLIKAIDSLKGFHKSFFTDNAKKLLRIIVHFGIYEYLRMPFGIKNAPSHYQRMISTIFPEELSNVKLLLSENLRLNQASDQLLHFLC